MRPQFDDGYIRDELEHVGDHLTRPVTAYLLGGGAMAFRGLKDTTKDIDLVVGSGDELARLQGALADAGYDVVHDPDEAYEELGAQRILENADGCRFDVFNQQVVGKLVLTDGMKQRSEPFVDAGELEVRLVSPEDIFLFKSVAGRVDDIEDMYTVLQTGIDFDAIETEVEAQIGELGGELFVTYVNDALGEMEERFGATTPLREWVAERTERVYEEIAIVQALEEGETISESGLHERVGLSESELTNALTRLEAKGVVDRDGETILYSGGSV